jgi:type III pantothenate kinase
MDLLIDIGNTRIKWATLEQQRLTQQHAAVYVDWDSAQIREQILNKLSKPTRVLIANVGGDRIGALLADTIEKACDVKAQFVHASVSAAGVRAGYQYPEKLGVDRWLAIIAAYHLERRATCVVSIGTAMTVDGVDASGQHLGGIIVPGPDLMLSSLYRGTSEIAVRARDGNEGSELFADNTQAAVHQGITHTLAAIVERASYDMQSRLGEMPALLVTGGASGRITGALRVPYRLVPDLVLRGLAELARA